MAKMAPENRVTFNKNSFKSCLGSFFHVSNSREFWTDEHGHLLFNASSVKIREHRACLLCELEGTTDCEKIECSNRIDVEEVVA